MTNRVIFAVMHLPSVPSTTLPGRCGSWWQRECKAPHARRACSHSKPSCGDTPVHAATGHRRASCVHPRPQREAANERLWDTLYGPLNTGQRAVLDSLLPLAGLIPTIWAASL